ncbi:MAG: hypothetical protein AAB427_16660, partial [Chloroflexota bacterium]
SSEGGQGENGGRIPADVAECARGVLGKQAYDEIDGGQREATSEERQAVEAACKPSDNGGK